MNYKKLRSSLLSREVILFGLVGIVSTLTHFTVLVLLVEYADIAPVNANLAAFFASLIGSYSLNHRYTFQSEKQWRETFPKYFIAVLIGLFLNQSIMWISIHKLEIAYIYGFALVAVIVPVSNFLLHKYWTFSQKRS